MFAFYFSLLSLFKYVFFCVAFVWSNDCWFLCVCFFWFSGFCSVFFVVSFMIVKISTRTEHVIAHLESIRMPNIDFLLTRCRWVCALFSRSNIAIFASRRKYWPKPYIFESEYQFQWSVVCGAREHVSFIKFPHQFHTFFFLLLNSSAAFDVPHRQWNKESLASCFSLGENPNHHIIT